MSKTEGNPIYMSRPNSTGNIVQVTYKSKTSLTRIISNKHCGKTVCVF